MRNRSVTGRSRIGATATMWSVAGALPPDGGSESSGQRRPSAFAYRRLRCNSSTRCTATSNWPSPSRRFLIGAMSAATVLVP